MKKTFFLLSVLVTSITFGQTRYWTSYNFTVEPQNEAAIYKLVDDYFKANPTSDDVNAYFYENLLKIVGTTIVILLFGLEVWMVWVLNMHQSKIRIGSYLLQK